MHSQFAFIKSPLTLFKHFFPFSLFLVQCSYCTVYLKHFNKYTPYKIVSPKRVEDVAFVLISEKGFLQRFLGVPYAISDPQISNHSHPLSFYLLTSNARCILSNYQWKGSLLPLTTNIRGSSPVGIQCKQGSTQDHQIK